MDDKKIDEITSESFQKGLNETSVSSQMVNEMARITPKKSGLHMFVVLNPKNGTNTRQYNYPCLKFQDSTNPRFDPVDLVTMSIDASNPTLLIDDYDPKLPSEYLDDLKACIIKNYQVLMDYWDDKIYEDDLIERIQPL